MSASEHSGTFFFDPRDRIYETHFPGCPVVPGSIILHAFLNACSRQGYTQLRAVRGFSFRKFISPGEYTYHVRASENLCHCKLYEHGRVIVSGKIEYET